MILLAQTLSLKSVMDQQKNIELLTPASGSTCSLSPAILGVVMEVHSIFDLCNFFKSDLELCC